MLGKRGSAASPYAAFYEGSLRLAPYAAHYLMLVALGKVMNLLRAQADRGALHRGDAALHGVAALACGRSRVPALLAFPLAYNLTLHYGFISFALSLPVLMLAAGADGETPSQRAGRSLRRSWLWHRRAGGAPLSVSPAKFSLRSGRRPCVRAVGGRALAAHDFGPARFCRPSPRVVLAPRRFRGQRRGQSLLRPLSHGTCSSAIA